MLTAYEHKTELPTVEALHAMIRKLLKEPAPAKNAGSAVPPLPAQFAWTEYEQLMISEAVHRGEPVYNVALRIDPNSLMRAAAFQLIRNVLHGSGTVIALRPEDNVAAATVEIIEAALASSQPEERIRQRCRIPSIVSDVRLERAATADTPEHELLGDLLEAQAARVVAGTAETVESGAATNPNTSGSAATAVAESTLRVDAARIDAVMNLVGELIIGKSMLNRALTEFDKKHARDPLRAKLADAMAFQARILDELHKCVLKIRMDPALLRAQAVEKGLLKLAEAQRLTEQETLSLIFEPGFSTASEVTEVSGRGIGMDVVRTVLDRLKGTVHISSQKGRGTTIRLCAPLTLASIQTLLFRVGGRLFAVPLSAVVEITRIMDPEIHRVDQRDVLRLRDQILTLVRLEHLSRLHSIDTEPARKKHFVIVIGITEKRFGLLVDSLVGEEELVIKALPGEIVSSDLVSGASILGDGTVVLILNVSAVLSRLSRAMPLGAIA